MKKILISAFTPFNNKENNYSQEVLGYIESQKYHIDKVIVDVIYDKKMDTSDRCCNPLISDNFLLTKIYRLKRKNAGGEKPHQNG